MKRKTKVCLGCGNQFLTFKNYDYCQECAINGQRYVKKNSPCSECDGSGIIKFPGVKPRPCKLCYLQKNMKSNLTKKLTTHEWEEQFWKEVRKKSKALIADLVEKVLPIDATPKNFDLERDVDYRVLMSDDLPQSYYDNEEYQTKMVSHNWTEGEVEYVAQEATVYYFELVAKSLARWLNTYPAFENTKLSQLDSQ